MRRKLFLTILTALVLQTAFAQPAVPDSLQQDTLVISLLTCTPGTEVYSKYGHSALRLQNLKRGTDWTFNYGVFNFSSDHFYARFVKGDTRYQLAVEETTWFVESSRWIGRTTYEQELNLTPQQKARVADALLENYRPENRYYLYNFVFDNCATRPYRLLRTVITDTLQAPQFALRQDTYREAIRHYSEQHSWPGFGIDFIFGKDADRVMTTEERLFLPEQLMDYVHEARLGNGQRLCGQEDIGPFAVRKHSWATSPEAAVVLVCLLLAVLTVVDMRRQRTAWWADGLLCFTGGLLGTIAFYLSFFSIHPLVQHNWNLLLVNPLLFIPAVLTLFRKGRDLLRRCALPAGLLLLVLLAVRLIGGQSLHPLLYVSAVYALRLCCLGWCQRKGAMKVSIHGLLRTPAVAALLFAFAGTAGAANPKLTVVVCVDGLNQQALAELRNYWPQGGLRTLDEEAHESTIRFPQLVNGGTETLATLMTGTTPSRHGISQDRYFLRSDRKVHNILEDNEQTCIGCTEHLSPKALLSPTLTDEFRIRHGGKSRIYAIGIEPEHTIILAGHASNAWAWIDTQTPGWATTGYYSEGLAAAADKMNIDGRFEELASREWKPRMDPGMSLHPTQEERARSFAYNQKEVLRHSPAANTLVTELALNLQKDEQLGQGAACDLLLLEYTVVSPKAQSDLLRSAEQEDMYLCLNQDLGFLMEQLSKRLGRDHFRLIVTGKPAFGQGSDALGSANLELHYFNTERAAALINTYLMAMYGHERWIDGGYMGNIYLNRTLLEQKKMPLRELQQQVSSFLLEFEGVESAYPASDIALLPDRGEERKLRASCNKRTTGDVVFTLQPLWVMGESAEKLQDRVAEEEPTAPLLVWTTERTSLPDRELEATEVKDTAL
ncbi:MAG: DUF4105 domain-containing protein [Paludibacteraceae bacterium]|nr:DUF4105 domain-containing protein [Paludibacteraceae bacterium]